MKTVALIPARCGSKSIPLKNIKQFCGRPLIYWNLQAIEMSSCIDEVYVATDCSEIEMVVKSFGFNKTKVYRRSAENAQDTSSTEAVMLEVIENLQLEDQANLVLVQATSPFTSHKDFDEAMALFEQQKADSLLTCVRTKRFYWNEDCQAINYNFTERPRRQDFKGLLMENGAFYINKVSSIRRDKNRLSGKIAIYEMAEYTATEIDEEDDWIIAEALMRKHRFEEKKTKIKPKLFLSDIDGVLTDAGMYYSENGDELKKFCTYDGKGFELLREAGIKTGVVTAEDRKLNQKRAEKLKLDFVYQGVKDKLTFVRELCKREGISLQEVAYIGDDYNDYDLLCEVGIAATPANSFPKIKQIPSIIHLEKRGGEGAVREFVEIILR
ncbi:acylneuraminate cytidylyltransferase [Rufibacter roseolus]|uniref:acylneuraminate cytidylyltransferase n=1 Tax=Rufibacter roseolus TaxID=2817375 RepID=UPI001B30264C|nr:acylneuraminate cytidylyltransferase [Rufibacter roseolus]